jgi:hypothetical protein
MKKLIIILAISFFGISNAFSQWAMDISWDASNCECSTGYFEIIYSIYDNARNEAVYTNEVISPIALTASTYTESVPDVQTHCGIEDEEAPSYTIHITVNLKCTGGVIPVTVCSKTYQDSGVSCSEFSPQNYQPPTILLEPVN